MVPSPWPSPEITDNLVQKISGYFLYTATIVKFVDEKDFSPMERLNLLIGVTHCRQNNEIDKRRIAEQFKLRL
jgi:hypothetical protein